MCLLGFNLLATIITMRAPGMTWTRLPIFVWSVFATSILMMLAAPMLIAALLMGAFDRTVQTAFFIAGNGGSSYLFQNLFWVFGHPEVYIVALPGFGIVLELLPVFARKPLWGYRLAVAGMLGVTLLSFFVWQHHLFVSGINADLRPFYMLSTELISLPTGFIFLCAMGTLWRGRIRFTVPMLFCLAWVFNFLWGGISGVFLSDVPSDVTTHGSFFVMAHFHYTIMGGLVFTFFAAIYYWGPKMIGFKFNETLAKVHFWSMFIAFNSTFAPLFALGFLGMPRRVVTYPSNLQPLNDLGVGVGVRARDLDAGLPLQRWSGRMLIKREPAEDNPWHSKSAEFQLPTPVPVHDFDRIPVFDDDPYPYGVEPTGAGAGARRRRGVDDGRLRIRPDPSLDIELEPPEWQPRVLWVGARQLCGAAAFFFVSFVFAYFYLRSLDANHALEDRPRCTRAGRLGPGDRCGADPERAWRCARRPRARSSRCAPERAALVLGAAVDRAAGDHLDDARLRPGQRRLRERVRRLDGLLRRVHAALRVLDRDPGRDRLAQAHGRASADRARGSRRGPHRPGRDRGRARRVLVLLELLRLQRRRAVRAPLPALVAGPQ